MNLLINILCNKPYWVFILYFLVTLVLYAPTAYAGFVTDFANWQEIYDKSTFSDLKNCFGYPGLHHLQHLVFYSFYKTFGRDSIAWYLFSALLHSGVAYLSFRVCSKIFTDFGLKNSEIICFLGAFIFLISPYHTDTIVWRVCFHYFTMGIIFLLSLWYTHLWLKTNRIKYIVYCALLYVIGLFNLELALAIPIMLAFYAFVWALHFNKLKNLFGYLFKILTPYISLTIGWVLLNQYFLGAMVGHYGADKHLNFAPILIFGNAFKYLTKILFFQRYWWHKPKEMAWAIFNDPFVLFALVVIGLFIFIWVVRNYKKLCTEYKLVALMTMLFFIVLLPVLNLFFQVLHFIKEDRYVYVASIFIFQAIAILLFNLPIKWKKIGLSSFIIISVALTAITNNYWYMAYKIHTSIIDKFNFYDHQNVVILNVPENVYGAPILYTFANEFFSTINHTLPLKNRKPHTGHLIEVAHYNCTHTHDGVNVKVLNEKHLQVEFNQWGTWFWRKANGATNYENYLYKVEFNGKYYDLYLKHLAKDYLFIYWNGYDWEVVNQEFSS